MRGSGRKKHYPPVFPPNGKERKKRPFFPIIPFSKPDLTLTCAGRQGKLPAMRIVFMGTGDIAIPAFRSLIRHGPGRPSHAARPPCRQAPGAYSPGHQKYCQGSGHSRAPAAFPAQPGCAEQPQETESGSDRRHGVRADYEPGSD